MLTLELSDAQFVLPGDLFLIGPYYGDFTTFRGQQIDGVLPVFSKVGRFFLELTITRSVGVDQFGRQTVPQQYELVAYLSP